MNYPSDFTPADRHRPLCGVLAAAIVTDRTLAETREAIRSQRSGRWGGNRTRYPRDMKAALEAAGKRYRIVHLEKPKTLAQLHRDKVLEHGKAHILSSSRHLMAYRNTVMGDQQGILPSTFHPSRRVRIQSYIVLEDDQ